MKGKGGGPGLWDLLAGAVSLLLYGDVLVIAALGLIDLNAALDPAAAMATGILALVAMGAYFVLKRLGLQQLWRRLLLGSIAAALLLIALFCGAAFALVASLMEA